MRNGGNDGTGTGIRRRSLLGGAIGAMSMVGVGLGTMAAPAAATTGVGLAAIRLNGELVRRTDWGRYGSWQVVGNVTSARLVSSLTPNRFLLVDGSGNLYEYVWNQLTNRYERWLRGWGFTSAYTRLIAGLSYDRFLEITADGTLSLWSRGSNDSWHEQVRGWDWGPNNTRLITGLSADSFLEVQANGNLSKWVTHGASYREIPLPATGFHEGETRQVSGISGFVGGGGGAFYELNNFSEISRWSWAYDGASFEEEKFGTQGHEIWFIV